MFSVLNVLQNDDQGRQHRDGPSNRQQQGVGNRSTTAMSSILTCDMYWLVMVDLVFRIHSLRRLLGILVQQLVFLS